jgi:hypothetical protein
VNLSAAGLLLRARIWIVIMMAGLVVAGVTAFPLTHEVQWLWSLVDRPYFVRHMPWFVTWIHTVDVGIVNTSIKYPFIAYGTDWLAYAHLMIAIAFIGPLRDPVRNIWVIQFGMISCLAIIPLALIAGPVRGIPFWWTCIDMSFGVFGLVPLVVVYRYVRLLSEGDSRSWAGWMAGPVARREPVS